MLAVAVGVLLMSATVVFHIAGTIFWIHFSHARNSFLKSSDHSLRDDAHLIIRAFFLTTMVILFLHVAEVILWAVAYSFLPEGAGFGSFNDCMYFSLATYTTLGYGDIVIAHEHWRLLTGIQAMGGMLAFGWSSALLFAAVQQVAVAKLNQEK